MVSLTRSTSSLDLPCLFHSGGVILCSDGGKLALNAFVWNGQCRDLSSNVLSKGAARVGGGCLSILMEEVS